MTKLYRVIEKGFCGGFVVENNQVVRSAPFLYKRVIGKREADALSSIKKNPWIKVEQVPETT